MTAPFPKTSLIPGSASPERDCAGAPGRSGASIPRQSASFSAAPELGAEVRFQRSPTHHPETGFVRSRQFCTGIIEILDQDAKPLRLTPEQYEVVTDENA